MFFSKSLDSDSARPIAVLKTEQTIRFVSAYLYQFTPDFLPFQDLCSDYGTKSS